VGARTWPRRYTKPWGTRVPPDVYGPGADRDSGSDSGSDPGSDLDPDSGSDPGSDLDPGSGSDPGSDLDPGSGSDPGSDLDPDSGSGSDPGSDLDPDSGSGSDLDSDRDPDRGPGPGPYAGHSWVQFVEAWPKAPDFRHNARAIDHTTPREAAGSTRYAPDGLGISGEGGPVDGR
jgi:hypothetical protein